MPKMPMEKSVFDIREMVRRFRAGDGIRRVARDMGLSRTTVAKYRELAEKEGWLVGPELPELGMIEEALLYQTSLAARGQSRWRSPGGDTMGTLE